MIRAAAALVCVLLLSPAAARADQCFGPAAIHLEAVKASALPYETLAGAEMAAMIEQLREVIEIEGEPDSMIIVFGGEVAKIGFVFDGQLCKVVRGPARATALMLLKARGTPT